MTVRDRNTNPDADVLGVSAAARLLGRSENHVRRLADSNQLASFRDGANRRLFDRDVVERFLRDQERAGR